MATDQEFQKQADQMMAAVLAKLDTQDPDELDANLAMDVLTMQFADGSKCVLNRQTAAHQIWLAVGASAWHFAYDTQSGAWIDTKGRGRLEAILGDALTKKLGRPVKL